MNWIKKIVNIKKKIFDFEQITHARIKIICRASNSQHTFWKGSERDRHSIRYFTPDKIYRQLSSKQYYTTLLVLLLSIEDSVFYWQSYTVQTKYEFHKQMTEWTWNWLARASDNVSVTNWRVAKSMLDHIDQQKKNEINEARVEHFYTSIRVSHTLESIYIIFSKLC